MIFYKKETEKNELVARPEPHQASNIPPPHHIIVQPRPQQQQQPPPRPTVVTQILKRSPQVRLLIKSNFSTSFPVSLSLEVVEGSSSEDEVEDEVEDVTLVLFFRIRGRGEAKNFRPFNISRET